MPKTYVRRPHGAADERQRSADSEHALAVTIRLSSVELLRDESRTVILATLVVEPGSYHWSPTRLCRSFHRYILCKPQSSDAIETRCPPIQTWFGKTALTNSSTSGLSDDVGKT